MTATFTIQIMTILGEPGTQKFAASTWMLCHTMATLNPTLYYLQISNWQGLGLTGANNMTFTLTRQDPEGNRWTCHGADCNTLLRRFALPFEGWYEIRNWKMKGAE